MQRNVFITSLLALNLVAGSLPAWAAPVTTSPGKDSVFSRETAALAVGGAINPLSGVIAKGKAKRVLRVEAMLRVGPDVEGDIPTFTVTVNDIFMGTAEGNCDNVIGTACTVTGSFWLDLDSLIDVVGSPLTVTMTGSSGQPIDAGELYAASFSAQMVKK